MGGMKRHVSIVQSLVIWVDGFFVENSVETFKDVAKVEHLCEKKEKTILENLFHNKIFVFWQRKKISQFFQRFVSNILCPKNKKKFSEKQVLTLLVCKKKKKNKTFIYKTLT